MWMMFLAVFIGGGAGSVARWALGMRYNTTAVSVLPVGTLMANLIGAFVIGGALAYFARHAELPPHWKLLITTGLCGGLTTFPTLFGGDVSVYQPGPALSGCHQHSV